MPASVENMDGSPILGGRVEAAPVLELDRRQGSVTNAKTPVRRGEFAVRKTLTKKFRLKNARKTRVTAETRSGSDKKRPDQKNNSFREPT